MTRTQEAFMAKKQIILADTLRDIAMESKLNVAEKQSLRQIAKEYERLQWLALAKEQLPPGKRPHIVLTKAQELCFKDTAERIENWNDDVRIDYETVLCCQKQGD